ncbi:MAG: carbohydrate ABC transporter permease [Halorhabdus sp.]
MANLSETQFAYLLLIPALLLLTVIALWPLLSTFRMSLFADSLTGQLGEFVAIENYVDILSGARRARLPAPFLPTGFSIGELLKSSLTVTLIFTVVSVFFETIIGFGQALVLNQDFRGRRWVRVAIIIPWAVPIVIQGMIFYLMFTPGIGLFVGQEANPTILQEWGLIGFTPLANTVQSTAIVIIADIWKTTAFMALLILAGLQSIDRNLYEVARVSGASKWQQFKRITFPLVLPSVLIAMLFRTIQAMRVYGVINVVSGCDTVPSLSCSVISTFNLGFLGSSATIAFITATIIGLMTSAYIVLYARDMG